MTHHIGAFIQNTIKPLVEELDKLLGKCEHLKIDKKTLENIIHLATDVELTKATMNFIATIVVAICATISIYLILIIR